MIYLGIDPGAHSAVAIMSDNKIVDVISINTSKIKGTGAKLSHYADQLGILIRYHKPGMIYCEEPYIKFRNASKSMNKLLGCIELTAHEFNVLVSFINPSVVKKTITGNGRCDKDILAKALLDIVDNPIVVQQLIDNKMWDETDSIAIALSGFRTGGI